MSEPSPAETVVVATFQAKPGRGVELLAEFSELSTEVLRDEPGTLRFALYVEPDSDPLRLTLIEKYASPAAFQAHLDGVLVGYLPRLRDLLASGPDPVVLKPAELTLTVDDTHAARLRI